MDLTNILYETEIKSSSPILSQDTMGFFNNPKFDKESYELIKGRIENNPKLEKTHKAFVLLLSDSIF